MKIVRICIRTVFVLLAFPITYLIIALFLSIIPVNDHTSNEGVDEIFLSTNGIHADIVIPVGLLSDTLKSGMFLDDDDAFVAFGWGERNFFINTPHWSDLKVSTAFKAMLTESNTLIHVTRYSERRLSWLVVPLEHEKLNRLMKYISKTFESDEFGEKIRLLGKGYSLHDDFYEAKGGYAFWKTCNTWVNTGFKNAGLKAALWTPFDFGVLRWYE